MQPAESKQSTAVNSRQTLQGTDMDIKELALQEAKNLLGEPLNIEQAEHYETFATRLIAAYTEGQEPDESQNWKGMSGAVAWHLIDRHGEDWADIGNKMDAWLKANTAPPLPAIPDERIATLEQQNAKLVVALKAWDALIQYNYSGSREAMSAMQQCAFDTKDILDKVKQP